MSLFDKLFGKKKEPIDIANENNHPHIEEGEIIVATQSGDSYKAIRNLTQLQSEKLENSTISIKTGQLYTHFWTEEPDPTDRADPEWQNKVMFFWKADEPFQKKSLPPFFEELPSQYFFFQGDTAKLAVRSGEATPWFGMPGLGEKHVVEINNEMVTVPELQQLGYVEYFEKIELTDKNLDLLTANEQVFLHPINPLLEFDNGQFYFNNKPISISDAYRIGALILIKSIN